MASTYTQPNFGTTVTSGALNAAGNSLTEWGNWSGVVDVDNIRRKFGIGDYVAQLAPEQSLFFAYLSRVAKKPLDETVWKPLEYRPQWQRRNFQIQNADGAPDGCTETTVSGKMGFSETGNLVVRCNYSNSGKTTTAFQL